VENPWFLLIDWIFISTTAIFKVSLKYDLDSVDDDCQILLLCVVF